MLLLSIDAHLFVFVERNESAAVTRMERCEQAFYNALCLAPVVVLAARFAPNRSPRYPAAPSRPLGAPQKNSLSSRWTSCP